METIAVAMLLAGALALVMLPVFRPPLLALRSPTGPAAQLRALEARKAALYGAIREAGFDLRTDKVLQSDYEEQVSQLKAEAIDVVTEIERLKSTPPAGSRRDEKAIAAARSARKNPDDPAADAVPRGRDDGTRRSPETDQGAATFCTQCGRRAAAADRFCAGCGTALERPE